MEGDKEHEIKKWQNQNKGRPNDVGLR